MSTIKKKKNRLSDKILQNLKWNEVSCVLNVDILHILRDRLKIEKLLKQLRYVQFVEPINPLNFRRSDHRSCLITCNKIQQQINH